MTETELTQFEAIAKAATPGPWQINWWFNANRYPVERRHPVPKQGEPVTPVIISVGSPLQEDTKYIAAMNPSVALQLIAELRQERAEKARMRGALHNIARNDEGRLGEWARNALPVASDEEDIE